MFALHWICALTLALVSCLSAQPVKRDTELLDHISYLNTTILNATCPDDIRLYSPVDIRPDCMSSAWNCTINELFVLKYECSITKEDSTLEEAIVNVIIGLRKKRIIPPSSSPDCRCEKYKQTDVKQFLDNMKAQVERLNSIVTTDRPVIM
uniref:Interleukin n=1 Tax=Sinocyclocheilus anshuiensis TaxID=1608454 RepID=A0A671RPJ2_9TELE